MRRGAALALLAPVLAGCWVFGIEQISNPENPFDSIRVVAVAPVFDMTIDRDLVETDEGYSPVALGELLASELVQFEGFEVIRAQVVAEALSHDMGWSPNDPKGPEAARAAMASLGADALLAAAITEFDPYGNPRVAVAVELFAAPGIAREGIDIGRLLQAGKPFPLDQARRHGLLVAMEKMYDSNDRSVRQALGAHARYPHDPSERALDPEEAYSWDMENYFRFVFNQILREVVDSGKALQEAWRHGVEE
ncbi:MAG: hypothetical protein HY720_16550 [Planctomycetes bacterium]|nr:hypothetical protein [Planctomycetota bacterium]